MNILLMLLDITLREPCQSVACELGALFCCNVSLTGGLSVVLLELLSDVSISFILHACLQ